MTVQIDQGLVIVPAGAGAGKTHSIKTTLSKWVKAGLVRPDRILAVTFTEAAASELRERIRSGLLADGLVEEALAVERAYVSTIHGFGLRLLTEHAFAAGASPQPRHLGDAEREFLIRQALSQSKVLDPIKADPERFGYTPKGGRDESAEDALRNRVLGMIELLSGLGDKGRDPDLVEPALDRLDNVYGEVLADAREAGDELLSAVEAMLEAFPEGGMATITAKGPRETLEGDLQKFRKAVRNPERFRQDWRQWQAIRKLFVSNSRSKTPEGYDTRAVAIMEAADVLPFHPGPLADAKEHLRCLISCAQEVMAAYEDRKRGLGLIDFSDMIAGAERLLRTDETVRQAVLQEIDCVIIDEFQDTNPVQFALLWQLGAHAPRTLLVGDAKQSIMGFQGADSRLSTALATANPQATRPLDRNWRSTPAVMQFVNAMGQRLFGDTYTSLEPTRKPVEGTALEVLVVAKSRAAKKYSLPQEHVAERITRVLAGGETVTDRKTREVRAARPSDIALLVCRHKTAASYADELRLRGVPVRISENGWAGSPVIRAARAALAFAANPADVHSALILCTLGPEAMPLQDALNLQIEGRLLDEPRLAQLAAHSASLLRLPVSAVLDAVLAASGLRDWADSMADGGQGRADLLRLEAEAVAFQKAHRDLKSASGFYGESAKVFLGWLDAQTDERDFDRHPDPSGSSAEAVEIVTWHASKGREWPITVVAEFDNHVEERAGTTSADFEALDRIEDMQAVLDSARLIHTPGFNAPEAERHFIEDRRADFEANARNLLYVALTRARDRLILEWPAFLKERGEDAPQAERLFHVFEDACSPQLSAEGLMIGGSLCPATITHVPEQVSFTEVDAAVSQRVVRFGAQKPLPPQPQTPWRLQPSQIGQNGPVPVSERSALGDPWPAIFSDTARGTALHLALRTYLTRPELSEALQDATGLDPESLRRVAERADALKDWLAARGYGELVCELPVEAQTETGATLVGTIDLLAVGGGGCMVIDHKSGGSGEGVGPYWPQLSAYADLVGKAFPQYRLDRMAIFWIDHGTLEVCPPPQMAAETLGS